MPTFDPDTAAFATALADLGPTLHLIPESRLERIRIDVEAALTLALGVAPQLQRFREPVRVALGESFALPFDQLEPAARALGGAHADHMITLHGRELDEMVAQLGEKRGILDLEAQSLVQRKRMSASLLAELVGGTGYRAMAFDVLKLAAAFRKEWSEIEAHTPVTRLELDQADALAYRVITTLGENDQKDASSSPSADLRRRAYTHFVRTYDEIRRAITYMRWKERDADEIAPSLFAGRTRGSSDDDDAPPNEPSSPPASPGMPGAPPFAS
jgi:hypothetical protein